jgi:hypothetical protein
MSTGPGNPTPDSLPDSLPDPLNLPPDFSEAVAECSGRHPMAARAPRATAEMVGAANVADFVAPVIQGLSHLAITALEGPAETLIEQWRAQVQTYTAPADLQKLADLMQLLARPGGVIPH